VLVVQALFFADGGLLALGCNMFNLGFFPCFVAYPLIFRKLAGDKPTPRRLWLGCAAAAIVGLQLGAFCVVLETVLSGISELPFRTFTLLMQPIHLAIGIVEGLVTASVVAFVWKARPEVLEAVSRPALVGNYPIRKILIGLLAAAVITGAMLSWFASTHPDGLEWAMLKTSGTEELDSPEHGVHGSLSRFQDKTSFLPDYGFAPPESEAKKGGRGTWPAIDIGTTVSGLVGGAFTLCLVALIGFALKHRRPAA
jgi:cobalt/nickel transport system permease protein